jgi:hypothetical protein
MLDKKQTAIALEGELVDLKYMKSTHNWRLVIDVYNFDLIESPISVGIVENKE